MSIEVGRVFSNTVGMVKERWLAMIGLWATFLGALVVYFIAFGAVIGFSAFAAGSMFSNPDSVGSAVAAGSLGIGFIIAALIFYVGFFAIVIGQQGSMIAMASPTHQITFGEAFMRGLKGGLTLFGVAVLMILAMVVVWLVLLLIALVVQFLGEIGGMIVGLLTAIGAVYLACRFSVLVPVIVVENVYNPIRALNRTWAITSGHVLKILLIYIIVALIAAVVVVLPLFLMGFSAGMSGISGNAAVGAGIFMFLFMIVVYFAIMVFNTSLISSLHAEMSDTQAVELGKTFE